MNKHAVVFYNTENLFDFYDDPTNPADDLFTPEGTLNWTAERYQIKLHRIAEALTLGKNESPLAIGLSEVENAKVIRDLLNTSPLNKTDYGFFHVEMNDSRGMDLAFIFDKKRLQLIDAKVIPITLNQQPNWNTRSILQLKTSITSGQIIYFFVNHWASRKEGVERSEKRRVTAAKVLRKAIDCILTEEETANIVILGDFNDTPVDKSLHQILQAKAQHEAKKRDLINLLIEEELDDKGTTVFRGNWMVFDQIIVSNGLFNGKNGLKIYKNNAFIVKEPRLLYFYSNGDHKPNATYGGENYFGGYSDHLPVYILLETINL